MNLLIPLGLGGLAIAFLSGKTDSKAPGPQPPGAGPAPSADPSGYTEIRYLEGRPVVYFRRDVAASITGQLARETLYQVQLREETVAQGAMVFEVKPYSSGGVNAAQVLSAASASGQAVLGSITLGRLDLPSGRMVAVTKPDMRHGCQLGVGWAVLYDPVGAPAPTGPSAPAVPGVPGIPGVPGVPPGQPAAGLDPGMPPALRREVEAALADETIEPAALDAMAAAIGPKYPIAAAALRARAAELRERERLQDAKRGGSPFVIRVGDTGSAVAKYYTGDANRWRELPSVNPGMRVVKGPQYEYLQPWKVGSTILLPLSWRAHEKPLPPAQSGSAPGVPAVPNVPAIPEAPPGFQDSPY